jgi:ethanolamine utilization protein EutA
MSRIRLVGLDYGTTTSSGVIASATLAHNPVTGRQELTGIRDVFCSETIFTPCSPQGLDVDRLRDHLDHWLAAGRSSNEPFFGGGALITGLAARAGNAADLVKLVRSRLGDAPIAMAGDPCLESWVAFHASAAAVSRAHPERPVINLDIGGGTTNIALGIHGEVIRTGSLFVGARHVQVVPGTYRIVSMSPFAVSLCQHLGITKAPGDNLTEREVAAIIDFDRDLIESAIVGRKEAFASAVGKLHQQVPFDPQTELTDSLITLSGGVGELVYAQQAGRGALSTTAFGDLGIDLARALLASDVLAPSLQTITPLRAGRATLYGLLLHTTQIAGSTLFLPDPSLLPLRDIPILGKLTSHSTDGEIRDMLQWASRSPAGAALCVVPGGTGASELAAFGTRLARFLGAIGFPATLPLVLLVRENVGKALGHYVTRWGSNPFRILVIDEIEIRDARIVQIGTLHDRAVPVSFFGMS